MIVVHFAREDSTANLIRALETGRVRVGEQWLEGPLIVSANDIVTAWAVGQPGELSLEQLGPALAFDPDIILVGTGTEACLPDVELIAALAERGIGLEMMTTAAACRTYNVLVHEQRRVVVALFN